MSEQGRKREDIESQSGDPGRTPGAAEGDRETVEDDLQEKQGNDDSENYEQTKERKLEESDTGNNQ